MSGTPTDRIIAPLTGALIVMWALRRAGFLGWGLLLGYMFFEPLPGLFAALTLVVIDGLAHPLVSLPRREESLGDAS